MSSIKNNYSWVHKLKSAISLPEHIAKYCTGTIVGNNFRGDHGGKHESEKGQCLSTYNNGTLYKCFHCDSQGDIISFEMDYHGYTFGEACRTLAEGYGIEIPVLSSKEWTEEEKQEQARKAKISADTQEVMNEATDWYHQKALGNKEVMNYYTGRGITEATIEELKLGYAPPGNQGLYKALKDKYSLNALLSSGLIGMSENKDGSFRIWDLFEDRYIYPYWDNEPGKVDKNGNLISNVCYFVGGKTKTTKPKKGAEEAGKYVKLMVHSEENPQINQNVVKHRLWNHGSLEHAKEPKALLVTEGIIDAILARQELEEYDVVSPITAKINNKDLEWLSKQISLGKIKNDITICNDTELNQTGKKRAYDNLLGIYNTCQKIRTEQEKEVAAKILASEPKIEKTELYSKITDTLGPYNEPNIKIAILQKPPEVDKIDLADYLQKDLKDEAIFFLEHARTKWEFEKYVENDPIRFFKYNPRQTDSNTFLEATMVAELLSEGRYFVTIDEFIYSYDSGVYKEDEKGEIKKIIQRKLKKKGSSALVNRSVEYLKMLTKVEPNIVVNNVSRDILNVKNGLVDLRPMLENEECDPIRKPHTPYHISFAQLPVNYDPNNEDKTVFDFFTQVLGDEDILELWKAIGYAIIPATDYDKAFLFYGEGGNGKSTTLEIITALIGEDNCSFKPLEKLETDHFATSDLYGKLVCINADLDSKYLPSNNIFKQLTGGDTISAQRKYGHPFNFKPYATLFFSANELPKTVDKSFANYRRWQFFGFDKVFTEGAEGTDPDIINKLITPEALSGLLNDAIHGWVTLQQAKGFKPTTRSAEILEEYREANNPVELFCNLYLTKLSHDNIPTDQRISCAYLRRQIQAWIQKEYPKKSIPTPQQINKSIQAKYSIHKAQGSVRGKVQDRWQYLVYQEDAEKILNQILSTGAKETSKVNVDIADNIEL